jgi:two-component system copper resistance phosphate regulon response regulator CusR
VRLLIIEDEPKIARSLSEGFQAEHFAVDMAEDGEKGLQLATEIRYDGIVLDWNLPRMNGLSLLRKLRQSGSSTRVLILSGRREVADRVAGLQAGADDYLIKPFSFQELLARMQTLLRRAQETSEVLTVGDLVLDPQRHMVTRAGKPIKLSQREYALLEYLMRNVGRTVTRTMVVEHVWNLWFEGLTTVGGVYARYMRAKVDRVCVSADTYRSGHRLYACDGSQKRKVRPLAALL